MGDFLLQKEENRSVWDPEDKKRTAAAAAVLIIRSQINCQVRLIQQF